MKRVYRDWEYSSRKIFALVVSIAAMSLLMLLGSIIETRNESRLVYERPVVTVDSLCKSLKKELSQPSKGTLKKNSAMVEKVKDIELSLKILQRCVSEIEEQTASRQDDIRQETNNIINKFNGAISWWLLLLGIVCGFAPLVLAYLNHKNDSEYIKQLNSNYLEALQKLKDHEEKINGKLTELEDKKKEFESSEKKRNEELTSTRKKLELLHTFVYVASFTTKSQFQTSPERNRIVDKLLFELINNSLKCIKLDGEKSYISDDVDLLYWVMTSIEGITLLAPYQTDVLKLRRMNDIVLILKKIQTDFFNGRINLENSDDVKKVHVKMEEFKTAFGFRLKRNY